MYGWQFWTSIARVQRKGRSRSAGAGEARAFTCSVLDQDELESVKTKIEHLWGAPDYLINGAGGNSPRLFHDPSSTDSCMLTRRQDSTAARAENRRAHAYGPLQRARGARRNDGLASVKRLAVRDRQRGPHRRRLLIVYDLRARNETAYPNEDTRSEAISQAL